MDTQLVCFVVAAILVVVGIAGTVLPALPGLPLVFAGMLLAAWADDFQKVGPLMIGTLAVLTVLSIAVDLLATAVGAKRVGASRLAVVGAVVGTFAGLFFGPIGLLAGPFVGALIGELLNSRELGKAAQVGFGTWLGLLVGVVLKLGLAFAMLGLFAFAWLF
ncbi:DUF456 domain-containing protein [Montanilutibacter psychrotolerans]|uniref:DUF456 domain-containing protein n=1 Tax=Montanilutibacter psychrotolerans TaxID=1327343 RepID=A0A3M8SQY1_9GAMM|nr:DUF456 domain-containing protein [Lysobacter psychrotolerans]RNF83173.1 DUF456 domain-containing protein [Lysobacter psychrotolerans]